LANVRNVNDILLGTGVLYINGVSVGQLKNDVVATFGKEFYEIEAGFPKSTIKEFRISESAQLTAGMLEVNLDNLNNIMDEFTKVNTSAGETEVTYEHVADISYANWVALAHQNILDAGVTVYLASLLTANAASGQKVVQVADASIFTAGDAVQLVSATANEEVTIDAEGVDTDENTITMTTNLVNSYEIGDQAADKTVSLDEATDYYIDRIDGKALGIDGGDIPDGCDISIAYTYDAVTGTTLYGGGKTTLGSGVPIRFEHTRSDGKILKIEFFKALVKGDLEMPFHEDTETILNITISAQADSTRDAGKQLYAITLENAA